MRSYPQATTAGNGASREVYQLSSFESLATGKKLEVLSQKISQLQQEMVGLRQDVRAVMRMLQDLKQSQFQREHEDSDSSNNE